MTAARQTPRGPVRRRAPDARGNRASALESRRAFLRATGALVVGFTLGGSARAQLARSAKALPGKTLDANDVDGFLAIDADSSVTIYCGKVDLGQGLRIAIRQMAAEELGCAVDAIAMIEGDTALKMRVCVPQRHRLPASPCFTWSSVGWGVWLSNDFVAMTMPLVQ